MVTKRAFGQLMDEADNPAFFKILRRGDISSEIMRIIPHHFIRSISDKPLSFKMVLKVPWGSSWPVKICKNPDFYYMEDRGWEQFVIDNGLGENEYLILTFTHEANMCFNVNIYEANGMEMLKPRKSEAIASNYSQNKREQRKNIYTNVIKEEIESSSESTFPGLKPAESSGKRLKQKQELNLGKKEAEEPEKSKNSNTTKKGIPKKFVDLHMPHGTKTFKIHHPKGKKSWEVMYLATDIQSRFSAGWSRLAKDVDLEVGDVCTFKLIKPTEMLLKISKKQSP